LPENWEPTEANKELARKEGLDVEREAMKFRLHAEASGRKQISWNAAFSQWLLSDYGDKARNKPPEPPHPLHQSLR